MRLVITGNPIAKCRPRFSSRGKFVHAYDSQHELKAQQKALMHAIFMRMGLKDYFSHPLSVSLEYHMPCIDSDSLTRRNEKLWGFETPCHKPDIDNLVKWTFDIANGIIWHDDAQIIELHAIQKFSDTPCTIIEVTDIKTHMNDNVKNLVKIFTPNELEEFHMKVKILEDALSLHENCEEGDKILYLEAAAKEMKLFSMDFSKKLTKLAK